MSKILKYALLSVTHPNELRSVINWAVWRDPTQDIMTMPESGYSRPEMKRCWEFLDMTSRSFSAVIKELEDDLCRFSCLFYLVLRGLDTIEDDMSIDLERKEHLLLTFHERLSQPGWNFKDSGPNENDRQLLVEFDKVIAEMMLLEPEYREIITRICKNMGYGMAHYARAAETSKSTYAVDTLADYDLYCHYVAGLVGEGLSAIFSASGKEIPELGQMLTLSNSMGLMLQKTNITRDFREDLEDGRFFWPREIWGEFTEDPKDFYLKAPADPEMQKRAMWALSGMVLDALVHATDCLDYITLLKNQSVFNFCAIPQVMAIATLEACFMNPAVFKTNVKIRKSLAVHLISKATNPYEVSQVFRTYARRIHKKAVPSDPHFVRLCIVVGQIEQWCENRFPSWVFAENGKVRMPLPVTRDDNAAKQVDDARIRQFPSKKEVFLAKQLGGVRLGFNGQSKDGLVKEKDLSAATPAAEDSNSMTWEDKKMLMLFMGGIGGVLLLMVAIVGGLVWYITTASADSFVGRMFANSAGINSTGTARPEL